MGKYLLPTLIVAAVIVTSVLFYPSIPAEMPNAFANAGDPSSQMDKNVILAVSIGNILLLYSLLWVLPLWSERRGSRVFPRFQRNFISIWTALLFVMSGLHGALIAVSLGYNVDMLLFVPLGVGLVLAVTGNALPRFKEKMDTGLPITIEAAKIWNSVSMVFAKFLSAGAVLMMLCALLPYPWMLIIFFVVFGVTIAGALISSYVVYRRTHTYGS
jgi:uncharacterized membrane protein